MIEAIVEQEADMREALAAREKKMPLGDRSLRMALRHIDHYKVELARLRSLLVAEKRAHADTCLVLNDEVISARLRDEADELERGEG